MSDRIEPFVVPADEYARLIDALAERDEARAEVERLREPEAVARAAHIIKCSVFVGGEVGAWMEHVAAEDRIDAWAEAVARAALDHALTGNEVSS